MCLSSLAYIRHSPAPHRRAVTPDWTVGAEASQTPQAARQSPPSLRLLLSPLFHTSHLPPPTTPLTLDSKLTPSIIQTRGLFFFFLMVRVRILCRRRLFFSFLPESLIITMY